MKCKCCGAEISEHDRYCKKCGQNNEDYVEEKSYVDYPDDNEYGSNQYHQKSESINNNVQPAKQESIAIGVLGLIFSILGGWAGLIFDIVGLCIYKEESNKKLCKIGLGIFCAWIVILLILFLVNLR